jgi:SNF2 family DNA or RNA helicase
MHRSAEIAHGTREKRAAIVEGGAEIIIINFDGVEIVKREIDAGGFDLIIIDEATAYKNVATKRWKTLNRLIKPETYVYAMTGTPAAQDPTDAYGLAKLISPEKVPRAFNAFRDMVQVKTSMFTFKNRPDSEQIVHSVLQPAIRFTQAECLDLPELVYQTREVPLSIQQEKYYKMLKKEMLFDVSGHEVSAANAAVALNKLLQISAGCVYAENGDVVEFDITNRVNELLSVIDETAHKVIVFVMFRHTIEVVQKHLQDAGHTVDIIHGGISANKRAEIFNDFQTKPDPRILVIQPQAASHGVTLHAANVVVWFGMTLSLETYLQANARIHRQGQVNHCTIVHLIGSKVEKKVLSVLEGKNTAQTKLLDLFKDVIGG